MFAVSENALTKNFGRWSWGDQILSPKVMNVMGVVGTKLNNFLAVLKIKQYTDAITTKWKISTKWNAQPQTLQSTVLILDYVAIISLWFGKVI